MVSSNFPGSSDRQLTIRRGQTGLIKFKNCTLSISARSLGRGVKEPLGRVGLMSSILVPR